MSTDITISTTHPVDGTKLTRQLRRINHQRLGMMMSGHVTDPEPQDDTAWVLEFGGEKLRIEIESPQKITASFMGPVFAHWFAGLIANEIAREFGGTIVIAGDETPVVSEYPTFLNLAIDEAMRFRNNSSLDEFFREVASFWKIIAFWDRTPECVAFSAVQLVAAVGRHLIEQVMADAETRSNEIRRAGNRAIELASQKPSQD